MIIEATDPPRQAIILKLVLQIIRTRVTSSAAAAAAGVAHW